MEYNAYVFDARLGAGFETLAENDIPQKSVPRNYRGYLVHFLWRDRDGTLTIRDLSMKMAADGVSPHDLYDALYDKDSPALFCEKENQWKGPISKVLFGVIAGMLFFLFLIWAANIGD